MFASAYSENQEQLLLVLSPALELRDAATYNACFRILKRILERIMYRVSSVRLSVGRPYRGASCLFT